MRFCKPIAGASNVKNETNFNVATSVYEFQSTTKLFNYEDFGRMKSEISQAEFSRNKPSDLPKVWTMDVDLSSASHDIWQWYFLNWFSKTFFSLKTL